MSDSKADILLAGLIPIQDHQRIMVALMILIIDRPGEAGAVLSTVLCLIS